MVTLMGEQDSLSPASLPPSPPGRSVLHRAVSSFTVRPRGCHVELDLSSPRHGQHVATTQVPLAFTLTRLSLSGGYTFEDCTTLVDHLL